MDPWRGGEDFEEHKKMSTHIPKVTVPEGVSGCWAVERFTVTEHGSMMSYITGRGRGTPQGEYTRLTCGRCVVMSDTPDEMRDHWQAVRNARGECLIHGLGLGMVVNACLLKPEVSKVTVIELEPDVIALVADHYRGLFGDRVEIVQADALTWEPPKNTRYNMVWHDIWPDICADNLDEMKRLHRRYGRRSDWQGSWSRNLLQHAP